MSNWRKIVEYLVRFLFVLLAIAAVGAALLLVSSGIGIVVLIVLAFFSLIIASQYGSPRVELGDYVLDLTGGISEGYDGLVEHANQYSTHAAQSLQNIKNESPSGDPFHELAVLIDKGLDTRNKTAMDLLLSDLKTIIEAKKYIAEFDETDMKVVRFLEDELYVNSSGKEEFLKRGMKFRVYRETVELSDETAEDVTPNIGIASVTLASKGTTQMKIERWMVPLDNEDIIEIRNNDLKGKRVFVDAVIEESITETPIEELEEAYQQLKPIHTKL